LIGDAAGFCDPITGEGIYYSFKSADLLGDALTSAAGRSQPERSNGSPARSKTTGVSTVDFYARANCLYEESWRESFGHELENASGRLPRFYRGFFLGQIFTDAMIRFARHHRGVRTVLGRAITGDQSYITLKRDLLRRALQVF
jgi:flavin-dependent dehydrogenase